MKSATHSTYLNGNDVPSSHLPQHLENMVSNSSTTTWNRLGCVSAVPVRNTRCLSSSSLLIITTSLLLLATTVSGFATSSISSSGSVVSPAFLPASLVENHALWLLPNSYNRKSSRSFLTKPTPTTTYTTTSTTTSRPETSTSPSSTAATAVSVDNDRNSTTTYLSNPVTEEEYDYIMSLESAMQQQQQQKPSTDVTVAFESSESTSDKQINGEEPSPSSSSSTFSFMGLNEIVFARILLLGAAALYGTNFSLVKILGNMDIPIGISATLRFGLAALVTSPWLFAIDNHKNDEVSDAGSIEPTKKALPQTAGKLQEFLTSKNMWSYELGAILVGLEAGIWNSMAYITQAVGLTTTAASKSAFLCSLAVVIVPLLDRIAGKKLEIKQMIGVALALAGVAILELGGLSSDQLAFTSGDVASLMQPLAFGMAFWRMESAMHNYPDQASRLTAAQLLAVFSCSALFTSVSDPASFNMEHIIQWITNPTIAASLAWTGLVSTALTVYMETVALKSVTAAETTLILSTEPLWGSFFAAILMGETFGFDAAIGGIMILLGCVYSSLGAKGIQQFLTRKET